MVMNYVCAIRNILLGAALALTVASGYAAHSKGEPKKESQISGTVVQTTNAASYTYVQVDTGKEKIWAAAPQFQVKVGEKISFPQGMLMKNYQSKTLNRTFDEIYFVDSIGNKTGGLPPGHPPIGGAQDPHAGMSSDPHAGMQGQAKPAKAPVDFSGLKKADKGYTVAEVYKQRDKLAKKQVAIRGKVVKYNEQILGKNWIHIQDGTGSSGSNDLTVTTSDKAKVGDTVLVAGTLALDKDFGSGYKYGLIVENAKVAVEKSTGR